MTRDMEGRTEKRTEMAKKRVEGSRKRKWEGGKRRKRRQERRGKEELLMS